MPKLRRSDGRPEYRSIDDIIKDALDSDDLRRLPGWGRPIDLDDYFSSGPDQRVAHRLLKDNRVLPQSLQDRKDAEDLRLEADTLWEKALTDSKRVRGAIERYACALAALFADQAAAEAALAPTPWPDWAPTPCALAPPTPNQAQAVGQTLGPLVTRYNRRVELAVSHRLHLLQRANECIDRLNRQVVFSRDLPAGLQLQRLGLENEQSRLRQALPRLAELPPDLCDRLRAYTRGTRPSLWRLLHRG